MAVTLRQADEQQAYTLADQATFWQLERRIGLVPVFAADPRLLNTYAVVYPSGDGAAARFAAWLAQGDGRSLIASFRAQERAAFTTWPAGMPWRRPQRAALRWIVVAGGVHTASGRRQLTRGRDPANMRPALLGP
jgi:hypothetical protein